MNISKLRSDLVKMYQTLDEYTSYFNEDGIIDANELKFIEAQQNMIEVIQSKIDELEANQSSTPSSPNFKFTEFVFVNRPYYSEANGDPKKAIPKEYWSNIQELMDNLEIIRKELNNSPIKITSGYRNEAHNKSVGGAKNSQHLYGKASDIKVRGFTPSQVYSTIIRLIDEGKIKQGGVGKYNTFVHYDIRGYKARW